MVFGIMDGKNINCQELVDMQDGIYLSLSPRPFRFHALRIARGKMVS